MTVFANGLEVACKAQSNKVIAAFPDVCFTPPENPATPPGVPVPYPSFGMDSDTDKGTCTVKIGGKTVTQKNKSYYTKTTGTEAGCAAKKGIITSKNTGKEYAVAWSGNVKMDGEPVSRFSDISTNNHASPTGNTPPIPKIGKVKQSVTQCEAIFQDMGMTIEPYNKIKCPPGHEREHFFRNEFLCHKGRTSTRAEFKNYSVKTAPCICMRARNKDASSPTGYMKGTGSKTDSPHYLKTQKVSTDLTAHKGDATVGTVNKVCADAFIENHDETKDKTKKEKKTLSDCLQLIFLSHLTKKINEARDDDNNTNNKEVHNTKVDKVSPNEGILRSGN